jgi:hypothetical protein
MKCLKRLNYDATNIVETFEWCLLFRSGQNSVVDFESSGRPPSNRTEEYLEK